MRTDCFFPQPTAKTDQVSSLQENKIFARVVGVFEMNVLLKGLYMMYHLLCGMYYGISITCVMGEKRIWELSVL